MDLSLEGKTALITGGGRGIGRATVLAFAEEGANVAINYSRSKKQGEEVRELALAKGVRAISVPGDVSKPEEVEAMFAKIESEFRHLDILVNNAGIASMGQTLREISLDLWQKIIDVNLKGTFLCCQRAIKFMEAAGGGAIINLSSVAALKDSRVGAHYSAAKAGILGLTRTLARELGPKNIRINALAPAAIVTEMWMDFTPEQQAAIKAGTSLQRLAGPEEVADLIVFLSSTRAGFITGQTIVIDGGSLMH